ncbi:RNase adapter RapZ [Weissella koreensis]|uniref:RNase adapter RapZ n=1 Tax=Weissella koreensis TaxID=165096 RepID=A0A7H1MMC7_9LACO|nr:RNase adapter RapZ [Weissella koreensis]AEJ23781.1 glmZ(sRNA)-inactivating NTPase [Weissella koreensis KACC 15510]AVH75409.1 RNase adapter RapZ [Weissella koreensis]EJF34387.1 ATP-binding protein [Weissella koreensis KCTC 3621]QGN20634.1 RNase adapter RapZ [Weissella koreensis]QNT64613.1 RNase adapter RapZ [Weissella koreensis]
MHKPELVVITGVSGAGKTVAMRAFEDLNYFTTDNLPAEMLPNYWALMQKQDPTVNAAVVIDLRSEQIFANLSQIVQNMLNQNQDQAYRLKILFLDASDGELVARYKETRRHHPLSDGSGTLDDIKKERNLLDDIKGLATEVIDTSNFGPRELRKTILRNYGDQVAHSNLFKVQVMSFGFKYGAPLDADLVIDVRFLDNPYYIPKLRNQTGIDDEVYKYVWKSDGADEFYQKELGVLEWSLPRYKAEGRSILTIAFGCTGGQHRSVAFAHRTAKMLQDAGWPVTEYHRDMQRRKDNGQQV